VRSGSPLARGARALSLGPGTATSAGQPCTAAWGRGQGEKRGCVGSWDRVMGGDGNGSTWRRIAKVALANSLDRFGPRVRYG
jgi:hypothetical protein